MWAAAAFLIAGALWNAYSHYQAGLDEANLELKNAAMAEAAADAARKSAAADEAKFRRTGEKIKGSQKAAAGASGATMETFEPVFVDTAKEIELDALNIRYQGELERTKYKQQAEIFRSKADIARRSGKRQAIGSLLSGGASASGALS